MKEGDKKEIRQIFNEGFEQLVLPHLDRIYEEMATKKELQGVKNELRGEIKKVREDLGGDIYRVERKLDAEVEWRDGASKRLKKVEVNLGLTE